MGGNLISFISITLNRISGKFLLKKYSSNLSIGNSIILPTFSVDFRNRNPQKKYVSIGDDCMIGANFVFESSEGEVAIGDRVYLGSGTIICRTRIEFGNDIFVGWNCCFYDHDSHSLDYRQRQLDMKRQLEDYRNGKNFILSKDWSVVNAKPIKIMDHAWIGMSCIILKGVTIGEGAVVGAGSIVSKDVPPWTIVAGNPASVIRQVPPELRK
jgi:acetyltransferase-like isoleucine patch superfamily enzyme